LPSLYFQYGRLGASAWISCIIVRPHWQSPDEGHVNILIFYFFFVFSNRSFVSKLKPFLNGKAFLYRRMPRGFEAVIVLTNNAYKNICNYFVKILVLLEHVI
jgi:hypothetical protein